MSTKILICTLLLEKFSKYNLLKDERKFEFNILVESKSYNVKFFLSKNRKDNSLYVGIYNVKEYPEFKEVNSKHQLTYIYKQLGLSDNSNIKFLVK